VSRPAHPALLLAGILLVAANLRAPITSVGPVLGILREDQHLSAVAASVLISLPLVAFAAASPVAPSIAARLGLERTIAVALAALAAGIALRSVPPQPLLWAGTALLGVGIALVNVLLPSLVKRDFPSRIGPVTGAYSASQSAFAAVAAGLAVPLAGGGAGGWRLSLGVWAGLALLGLGLFGAQHRRAGRAAARAATPALPPVRIRAPWGSALAWQVTVFMGLQSFAYYVLIAWLASIEQAAGATPVTAGLHQLLLNLFALLGSIASSAAIHRLAGQRSIAVTGALLLVIALTGLLAAPGLAAVWASIAGFSAGGTLVLALSLFGLRTRHHDQAAALSGMAQSIGYALAALGPIVVGAVHDATDSWPTVLLLLIAIGVVQGIVGTLASRPRFVV
jgi:MFS transporter, CP family, cyanate transporter